MPMEEQTAKRQRIDAGSGEELLAFKKLACGEVSIYHCCQLYDYRSKIESDDFETGMLKGILAAANAKGLTIEKFPIFMPFRDTDQSEIKGDDVTLEIFKMDMSRLSSKTFGVVGFSDTLSKDSGEMFELGRGFALGLPTIITTSDFIWFSNRFKDLPGGKPIVNFPFDPVIMAGVGKVLTYSNIPSLGEESVLASGDFATMMVKKEQSRRRLNAGYQEYHNLLAKEVEKFCLNPKAFTKEIPKSDIGAGDKKIVYLALEGQYEWQKEKMGSLQKIFEADGFVVRCDERFDAAKQQRFVTQFGSEQAVFELGRADLANLACADIVVILGDGAEFPMGCAFMQGYAHTAGKKVVDYITGNIQLNGPGGYSCLVNSMLQYSNNGIAKTTEEVIAHVRRLGQ